MENSVYPKLKNNRLLFSKQYTYKNRRLRGEKNGFFLNKWS